MEERDSRALVSTYAPKLGRSLCELGRYDEAERLAERGRELGEEHDSATQVTWREKRRRSSARAEAIELYERKGNVVMAGRARAALEE